MTVCDRTGRSLVARGTHAFSNSEAIEVHASQHHGLCVRDDVRVEEITHPEILAIFAESSRSVCQHLHFQRRLSVYRTYSPAQPSLNQTLTSGNLVRDAPPPPLPRIAHVMFGPKLRNHRMLAQTRTADGLGLNGIASGGESESKSAPLATPASYCDNWLSRKTVRSPGSGDNLS